MEVLSAKWTWYWRTNEDGAEADCGITAEIRPGHAYAVMRCPRYMSKELWDELAKSVCDMHNASLPAQ